MKSAAMQATKKFVYAKVPGEYKTAEVDYLLPKDMKVMPFEVKAGVQGGMRSLWGFMREKKLMEAIRCSLENFGQFDYIDEKDENAVRHVTIYPIYAISMVQ